MLQRSLGSLTKAIKPTITPSNLSRSASRFTRSRRGVHPPSSQTPSHARTTPRNTTLATSNTSEATPEPPTELSILGPPISRIPVEVPHDPQGILDLTRGDWSTKVKDLLSQPAIVVARQIEFMNIFLGFEQANRVSSPLTPLFPKLI